MFDRFQTTCNKCQHCGSMQKKAKCWAQQCCVLLANGVASVCMSLNSSPYSQILWVEYKVSLTLLHTCQFLSRFIVFVGVGIQQKTKPVSKWNSQNGFSMFPFKISFVVNRTGYTGCYDEKGVHVIRDHVWLLTSQIRLQSLMRGGATWRSYVVILSFV